MGLSEVNLRAWEDVSEKHGLRIPTEDDVLRSSGSHHHERPAAPRVAAAHAACLVMPCARREAIASGETVLLLRSFGA